MNLKNLPFRIESEFFRWWYRMSGIHPSSAPFVSGDSFRMLADWYFEPSTKDTFRPSNVSPGSVGFCDGWLLAEFLAGPARDICVPFELISHNADPNVTEGVVSLLPSPLTKLYSTNVLVDHPKITSIPIGLENARFHYNGVIRDFQRLRSRPIAKLPRVLVAFTVGTNPYVRGAAREALDWLETVDFVARINSRSYRNLAVRYQFIASPPGNGEDCHRTWEACYLRAVPIVLRSNLTEFFSRLGLPLWVVDSYKELEGWDSDALDEKYRELSPGFDHPALWMPYWEAMIKERQ